tara:strand:- start:721 stop:1434 length:714 start_codon:yes stop_codon:yes gene_type:complete
MTEEIFNLDAYSKNCSTKVISIIDDGIELEKTVFFPGGGGQPNDHGVFILENGNEIPVFKVKRIEGKIFHYPESSEIDIGDELRCEINWDRRYKLMRTHTALHILCGVVWRDYGAVVTGGNMDILKGRMDFEFESLTSEMCDEIEEKVNLEIEKNLSIHVGFIPRVEALKIPGLIRTKVNLLPESITVFRTIDIEGLDIQSDGGTHVNSTKEVGKIVVTGHQSKGKINKRIRIEIHN